MTSAPTDRAATAEEGHPLLFGSFITPTNADFARTVGLAVLADQVGLDLVTFQDHPYHPGFLDTWTLLSYVAARTDTAHLAANVTNLPLRPPAVLARSVASLDLLSGGRVELGLGAGAFWDAIKAMDGHRLTGGESVRALEEGIDVIRQMWNTDARGGIRVEGQFHRVVGAKRGPAPAHDVSIWLGAYKPRMLALTGRRADGWLPSLEYLQPGDLAAGNAIIDEAAQEAGRSPSDVRRLLNINGRFTAVGRGPLHGPAEQWAEQLADLALENRISAFILGSDDPDALRRFAGEVAPAVRELVAAERSSAPSPASGGKVAPQPLREVSRTAFPVTPTHDDGTRRSSTRVWDESTRPAGPTPDPERTYTAYELATAQHLLDVHDGLRAELANIHKLIEQVAVGETDVDTARSHINQMTLRQNKGALSTYCESYCRIVTVHHTIEDRSLFPHLRRGDEHLAPVIDRLQQEHAVIHDLLEGVDRALVTFVSTPDGVTELRTAVDLLSDALLSHLAYEERELAEPIARLGLR